MKKGAVGDIVRTDTFWWIIAAIILAISLGVAIVYVAKGYGLIDRGVG